MQFYSLILLIVLAELSIAVLAFVFRDRVEGWMEDVLKEGMILRYQDDEDAVMDWFQEKVSLDDDDDKLMVIMFLTKNLG